MGGSPPHLQIFQVTHNLFVPFACNPPEAFSCGFLLCVCVDEDVLIHVFAAQKSGEFAV